MAEPTTFPQANLELVRPSSMTEEECGALAVYRNAEPPLFISCWRPTVDDLERLVAGAPIWIHVYGQAHPPIAVTTENPFEQEPRG